MIHLLRQFSIRFRFVFIVALVCAGLVFITWVSYSSMEHKLMEGKQIALQNVVDASHNLVAYYYKQFREGNLTEQEAKQRALSSLREMRYGANASEYIWVNDNSLVMLMHPLNPKLEGTSVADLRDPEGKYLFREMIKMVRAQGSGFVDYHWPRQANGKPLPKLSYVTEFEPWSWVMGSGIYIEDVAKEMAALLAKLLVALGVILVVLVGIISMLVQSITRPLRKTMVRLEEIASGDGDLTVHLNTEGNDELAALSKSFNRFVDKIRILIVNFNDSVQQLLESVHGLSQATDHSARNIQGQQSETELVATAMNEMSSAAGEIAGNADLASTHAHEANREASNSRDIVVKTSKEVASLAANMDASANAINLLRQETQNIDNVLSVIQGIAEQTNLLALNAAIEAARAGEQGRGFAVVADEVRTLAQRSHEATVEIDDVLGKIQSGVQEAVNSMQVSVDVAEHSLTTANNLTLKLEEILHGVTTINTRTQSISAATLQQTESVNHVLSSIQAINSRANDANDAVENTQRSTEEMLGSLRELVERLARFKV